MGGMTIVPQQSNYQPQQVDPLAQYARLVQLRGMQQEQQLRQGQGQLQQQQIQQNQAQLEAGQRQQQESQAFREAYSSATQKAPNATQ